MCDKYGMYALLSRYWYIQIPVYRNMYKIINTSFSDF